MDMGIFNYDFDSPLPKPKFNIYPLDSIQTKNALFKNLNNTKREKKGKKTIVGKIKMRNFILIRTERTYTANRQLCSCIALREV